jgi:hypothetical protein
VTADRIASIVAAFGVPEGDVVHARAWPRPRSVVDLVTHAPDDLLPSCGDVGCPEYVGGEFLGHYDDGTRDGFDLRVEVVTDDYGPCPTRRPATAWWERHESRGVTLFVSAVPVFDEECPCGCELVRVECFGCRLPAGRVRLASKGGGKMCDYCAAPATYTGEATARGECADRRDEEALRSGNDIHRTSPYRGRSSWT